MSMATLQHPTDLAGDYFFEEGHPSNETAQQAYDDADLVRAIAAYKFFYPTVSGAAIVRGNEEIGIVPNKVFGLLDAGPEQLIFTANSDTPYASILLDLSVGPLVVEVPAGQLMVHAMDIHQRWVADMGMPGADAGRGGRHLLLPPGFEGVLPASNYHLHHSASNIVVIGARALPVNGAVSAAKELLQSIEVHPLDAATRWMAPTWVDLTGEWQDMTPLQWEKNFGFWDVLHQTIDVEPPYEGYRAYYGELAALGIEKGKPFNPDLRTKSILERAARTANAQMRVQSFSDRRPDRMVWPDRQWEWACLRCEDGDFNAEGRMDLEAREKWFYQAMCASPAMFRRDEGAG